MKIRSLFATWFVIICITIVGFAYTNYANLNGADMNHATDGTLAGLSQIQNAVGHTSPGTQDFLAIIAFMVMVAAIFFIVAPKKAK